MQDYTTSLKFLRESQALLLAYFFHRSEAFSNPTFSLEIAFETNFLTFLVLWKVKKYREALKYVQQCAGSIRTLAYSSRTKLTLVGLAGMALAACFLKIEGEGEVAKDIVQQSLEKLRNFDLAVKPLMERLNRKMEETQLESPFSVERFAVAPGVHLPDYTIPGLPDDYLEGLNEPVQDLLVDPEFEELFFIANILANLGIDHIDPKTPLIQEAELEAANRHHRSIFLQPSTEQQVPLPIIKKLPSPQLFTKVQHARTDRSDLHRHHSNRSSIDARCPTPIIKTKRSPSCAPGSSAKEVLEKGRIQLKKAKANLKVIQKEALNRRKVKQNIMVQFTPQAEDGEVTYEAMCPSYRYVRKPFPNSAVSDS